jgi:hypothetical protein
MSLSSFRFETVWEQIAPVVDNFIRETECDLDAKGDISVQIREDSPNARIKTSLSSTLEIDLDPEKSGLQLFNILSPLIGNAIAKASPKNESVTEIHLTKCKNHVTVRTLTNTLWFVNLRTGLLIPPKIGQKREDSFTQANNKLRKEIPRFLNLQILLSIFVKNGNFSAFKQTNPLKTTRDVSAKDFLHATLKSVLFSGATRNQQELIGSITDGRLFLCQDIKHEDFNVRI